MLQYLSDIELKAAIEAFLEERQSKKTSFNIPEDDEPKWTQASKSTHLYFCFACNEMSIYNECRPKLCATI